MIVTDLPDLRQRWHTLTLFQFSSQQHLQDSSMALLQRIKQNRKSGQPFFTTALASGHRKHGIDAGFVPASTTSAHAFDFSMRVLLFFLRNISGLAIGLEPIVLVTCRLPSANALFPPGRSVSPSSFGAWRCWQNRKQAREHLIVAESTLVCWEVYSYSHCVEDGALMCSVFFSWFG